MMQLRIRCTVSDFFVLGIPQCDIDQLVMTNRVMMTDVGSPIECQVGMICVAESLQELIDAVLNLDIGCPITKDMLWVPGSRPTFKHRPYWVQVIAPEGQEIIHRRDLEHTFFDPSESQPNGKLVSEEKPAKRKR